MFKCKVCGAANSSDSSVCVECGAALRSGHRKISTDSDKEIFSNTQSEELGKTAEQRIDLFSSGEKYEKVRKGAVLQKIYEQEQAMGEITEPEAPPEPEKVRPIVINRQSSSDIVGKKRYSSESGKAKSAASKNHRIPQRIIEPSDSQLLGHKIKPKVTDKPADDDDEKVELTADNVIEDIRKRGKKSSKNQSSDGEPRKPKKSSSKAHDGTPKPKSKHEGDENTSAKNGHTKAERRSENGERKANSENRAQKKPVKKPQSEEAGTANRETAKKVKKTDSDSAVRASAEQPVKKTKPKKAVSESSEGTASSEQAVKKTKPKKAVSESSEGIASSEQAVKKTKPKKAVSESSEGTASSEQTVKKAKPKKAVSDKAEGSVSEKQKVKTKKKKPENKAVPAKIEVSAEAQKKKSDKSSVKAKPKQKTKTKPKINYDFTESDIDSNKNIAALSYIGILFLIPLASSEHSDFCRAHSKQGIAVFIYSLIINLLTLAAVVGLRVLLVWVLKLDYMIYSVSAAAIGILMMILNLVPVFSGAVSAFSGVYKSVPIVGKYVNKK